MSRDWIVEPVWQNYSSMYREVITSLEAETGMERSHHRTAALYFAIAALEAFLNKQMRTRSDASREDDIAKALRFTRFMDKVRNWPTELLGTSLSVRPETIEQIRLFNDIRADLTHPKDHGHETYQHLESLDPRSIIHAVAEYVCEFHHAEGETFPYWLWGWNYLNPRVDAHDIILVNDQQFVHSLNALGVRSDKDEGLELERWRASFMKAAHFPFQPKLCRRWWMKEHHATCGHVSNSAIAVARAIDGL